jgi:type I restriction enzyme M protein
MLTGELRSQVDRVWDSFWSGGIANPLEVLEQITYLLFLRRLDELETLEENKSRQLGRAQERKIFPSGADGKGCKYDDMRWSRLKNMAPQDMFTTVSEHVFPFLREVGGDNSTYAKQMQGARFTIPTPALLAKVVDLLDQIPMEERDTKGDLYEYMLSKIASAGQNGQFRTPRHIINLMVEMVEPTAKDVICDPASGTCGFLVAVGEYLRERRTELFADAKSRDHFHNHMFHGYDFDTTMLRIGSMNMLLHGVENPNITYRDSLSQDYAVEDEKYSLILANPPFSGSLDFDGTAKDLLSVVRTRQTEILFIALFIKLLKIGGRAAVIVPDGVVANKNNAYKEIRRQLVDLQCLEAVIALPSGVFRPYSDVTTSILIFTKTNSGGTDTVWFYDMTADGWSLDDKRAPLLSQDKLTATPTSSLLPFEIEKNNLPDILQRWKERKGSELLNLRTDKSFAVSAAEIAQSNYDLSIGRYKEALISNDGHKSVNDKQLLEVKDKKIFGEDYERIREIVEILKELETSGEVYKIKNLAQKKSPQEEGIREKVWSLSLEHIESNTGKITEEVYVNRADLGTSTFFFESNVVLFSKLRPYLNKVVIPNKSGYATTELVPIYCKTEIIHPRYLSYILRSRSFVEFATVSSGGAKMPRVKMDKFWDYKIVVPPISQQMEILTHLESLENELERFECGIQILRSVVSRTQEQLNER